MTLLLSVAYGQLFGSSPLAAPLLTEPLALLVASVGVGGGLTAVVASRVAEPFEWYHGLALVGPTALLPAVVVFPFVLRVGVVTGFGPTVTVRSVGHLVVGLFFVFLYAGFGAVLSGLVFVVVLVGSGVGAVVAGVAVRVVG